MGLNRTTYSSGTRRSESGRWYGAGIENGVEDGVKEGLKDRSARSAQKQEANSMVGLSFILKNSIAKRTAAKRKKKVKIRICYRTGNGKENELKRTGRKSGLGKRLCSITNSILK